MLEYCVFDIETTGLPKRKSFHKYFSFTELEKYEPARIVSIAWFIGEGDEISVSRYFIIKPEGFRIDPNAKSTQIHKITQKMADSQGVVISEVLHQFRKDTKNTKILVAHNINFDKNILLSESFRARHAELVTQIEKMREFCTMQHGKCEAKLPKTGLFPRKGYKFPRLTELYIHFFGKEFENAHSALADAKACLACYQKLISML